MERSDSLTDLLTALCQARLEFTPIVRNREGFSRRGGGKYQYADLNAIIDATAAPLARHGLMLVQCLEDADDPQGVVVRSFLFHTSGEFLSMRLTVVRPLDPQEFGVITSYMKRYMQQAMLDISTEPDPDGVTESMVSTGRAPSAARSPAPADQDGQSTGPEPDVTPRAAPADVTPELVAKMPKSAVVQQIGTRLRELVLGEGPPVREQRRTLLQTAMGESVRGDTLDTLALSKLRAGLVALLAMSSVASPPEEASPPLQEAPPAPPLAEPPRLIEPPRWDTAVNGLLPRTGVSQLRQWASDLGLLPTLEEVLRDCPGYPVAPQITEDVFTRAIETVAYAYDAAHEEEDVP